MSRKTALLPFVLAAFAATSVHAQGAPQQSAQPPQAAGQELQRTDPAAAPTQTSPGIPGLTSQALQAAEVRRATQAQADALEAEVRLRKLEGDKEEQTLRIEELRAKKAALASGPAPVVGGGLPPLPVMTPSVPSPVSGDHEEPHSGGYSVIAIYGDRHEAVLRMSSGPTVVRQGSHLPDGAIVKEIRLDRLLLTSKAGKPLTLYIN